MLSSIVEFLVMLNPFALFLYLEPIRKDLSHRDFMMVIFKATLISFSVCLIFFLSGDLFFRKIFQIDFESFRIFGGIIIFSYAYFYIVKGQRALIIIKENLDDLASEIALPFMVGAGSISLSILLGHDHSYLIGGVSLAGIFLVNFLAIFLLKTLRDSIEKKKFKKAFDKNMEVLLRLNGFFIGAIGINMVLVGIKNLFGIG
ncbi:MarC family protein [uncultured Sunxiuqinia sp.]|uniref:MarC family protein n=1 Tax=Sunxiuqinia rutila TaxID=1397841 RepID=UPI0026184FD3|nr:MarC family protein [uncultured Sunxiuqinia sp.]